LQPTLTVGHAGFSPATRFNAELCSELLISEQRQSGMQSSVLQFHSTGMQLTQSPGNAQGMETVSAEMTDLACDPRHCKAADAMTATGLKAIKSPDQPVAGLLHEIVAFTGSAVQQTVGAEVCQSKVHQDCSIPSLNVSGDPSAAFMASLTLEQLMNRRGVWSVGHG
tara:strand:- start:141 stop:641 length:501 start_codon:yes stop_codon:yes gene_type:complete